MARYRYNEEGPGRPAPLVLVDLRHPVSESFLNSLPALIDSGADRSVIPTSFVHELGLEMTGELPFVGLDGKISRLPIYKVFLSIQPGMPSAPMELEVATSTGEPMVLLGRDVLNHFRITLDGPAGRLDIEA